MASVADILRSEMGYYSPSEKYLNPSVTGPGQFIGADTKPNFDYATSNENLSGNMDPYFEPGDLQLGSLLKMGAKGLGGLAMGRIGVLAGREKLASEVIKRGLKEPWFHGSRAAQEILPATPGSAQAALIKEYLDAAKNQGPMKDQYLLHAQELKQGGFDPSRIGASSGIRLGEPAGISLSRNPEVASKFGDVLRVGVDVHPSQVGDLVDPEVRRLFRESYQAGIQPVQENMTIPLSKFLKGGGLPSPEVGQINQRMSDYLRSKGLEALAYNPRRWNEYEMRVLDPSKAVPLGVMPGPSNVEKLLSYAPSGRGNRVAQRYLRGNANYEVASPGLLNRLRAQKEAAPQYPVRIHEILQEGPGMSDELKKILGSLPFE